MNEQSELNFDAGGDSSGLTRWREDRRAASQALAQRLGLPLGYRVEVWLCGDIRLRGQLRLEEELLFLDAGAPQTLRLTVDGVVFAAAEIESCVRLD